MQPFTTFTGVAAPLYLPDIDTDILIPHRYLRKPLAAGYRNFLFHDERYSPDGAEVPGFVLNRGPFRAATILVAGRNFGCGSTREGAVYALADFGFRVVIAPGFADIFQANCLQNGLLPVVLSEPAVESLAQWLEAHPGATVTVDLAAQQVATPDGATHGFSIDASRKRQLLEGLDDIGITQRHAERIDGFEAGYRARFPWLSPGSTGIS